MQPTPTTELQAINRMLRSVGESPISQLDDGPVPDDVPIARRTLQEVLVSVQTKGWPFNTEKDYPLAPNDTGQIVLPSNIVKADLDSRQYSQQDVVIRGQTLYDRKNHTYTFDEAVKAEIVLLLPFEELPQTARHYIMVRASRIFQTEVLGSATLNGFSEVDEAQALLDMKEAEGEQGDYNILQHDLVNETLWFKR